MSGSLSQTSVTLCTFEICQISTRYCSNPDALVELLYSSIELYLEMYHNHGDLSIHALEMTWDNKNHITLQFDSCLGEADHFNGFWRISNFKVNCQSYLDYWNKFKHWLSQLNNTAKKSFVSSEWFQNKKSLFVITSDLILLVAFTAGDFWIQVEISASGKTSKPHRDAIIICKVMADEFWGKLSIS